MEKIKDIVKKLLYPHWAILALCVLLSVVGLAFVFAKGLEETNIAYIIYVLSAYALSAAVAAIVEFSKGGKERLHSNPFIHRYLTDLDYKAKVSLYLSFGINVIYSFYKAGAGIYYSSPWFGAVAFYYIILSTVRVLLLRHIRTKKQSLLAAYKRYRFCGYLLLILTVAIMAMGFHMVYEGKGVEYPGFVIYAAAGYTFFNFSMAIVNLVRYSKLNNPIYSAAKMITLATALVSIFFLQTAMFTAFGDDETMQFYMNIATASAVLVAVTVLSIVMIKRGNKALKEIESESRG